MNDLTSKIWGNSASNTVTALESRDAFYSQVLSIVRGSFPAQLDYHCQLAIDHIRGGQFKPRHCIGQPKHRLCN
jgi:hypothetical protein